jgi:hypothetical protein
MYDVYCLVVQQAVVGYREASFYVRSERVWPPLVGPDLRPVSALYWGKCFRIVGLGYVPPSDSVYAHGLGHGRVGFV